MGVRKSHKHNGLHIASETFSWTRVYAATMVTTMRFQDVLTAVVSSLCVLSSANAQVVRGDVSVGGGAGTDQRGVHSSAVTIAPSVLLIPNSMLTLGLSGSATRFGSNAQALGGSGLLGVRVPLGNVLALAASGAASMTTTSFNATYSSAELTPTLEATVGPATLFGGVHAASGTSTIRDTPAPGGVFSKPVGARDITSSRSSTGAVFGGVLDIDRANGAKVAYREEHARVSGVGYTDRAATGSLGNDRYALSGVAGLRDAPDEQVGFGSVTATLSLTRSVALQAAAGSYPSNRITGAFGGSFASIGLSFRGFRRLDSDDDAPVVRGVPAPTAGFKRLAMRVTGAQRVEIAGDWNKWTPVAATQAADGTWYIDVALQPGEHRYAFRIDGKRWMVPEGVASVDDGFGGRSALVTVR